MNNFQGLLVNMDPTGLVHGHSTSAEEFSGGIRYSIASSPRELARRIGGHVDIQPRESCDSSTVAISILRDLTTCLPDAGQDVLFNSHTTDLRWSGVFGTTWDSNLGQGEPFDEQVVDQRWTENFGPTYNSNPKQGLLSHDQMADQQWSGVFGNGWYYCPGVPVNERSAPLDHPVALQPFDYGVERV